MFSSLKSEKKKKKFLVLKFQWASANKPKCRSGFLNFSPINFGQIIFGQKILCGGGCWEHCRMISSISVLYAWDARSTALAMATKHVSRCGWISSREQTHLRWTPLVQTNFQNSLRKTRYSFSSCKFIDYDPVLLYFILDIVN